jgi:hypothetical protein
MPGEPLKLGEEQAHALAARLVAFIDRSAAFVQEEGPGLGKPADTDQAYREHRHGSKGGIEPDSRVQLDGRPETLNRVAA